jgi:chromosome segregation ATPase
MFTLLASYKWLLQIVAGIIFTLGIAYGAHRFIVHEQQIGYNKAVAEYTAKALAAEQTARAKEQDLNNQITEARNEAAKRDEQINKLADALDNAYQRLRDTTTTIRRNLPKDSPTTVTNTADAALSALAECSDRYSELAKTADEYASEIKLLQDSWPK